MIRQFCLYGFLKNQKYYEPFFLLALLEKGCSFTLIGVLFACRGLAVNLLEIPSGAVADCWGRRRSMILSFAAYITSFLTFALADHVVLLLLAMVLFAVGEAFRTGTHKAMIFAWLEAEGRGGEKTMVYGITRSWSQWGSALSVVIAAGIVLATQSYALVFWISIIPYLLGIINFLSYPAYLDGPAGRALSLKHVFSHTLETFRACIRRGPLRGLFAESLLFRGSFETTKDYIQPILQSLALALPVVLSLGGEQRTALLIGAVYSVLYIASALSARSAALLSSYFGGDALAGPRLCHLSFLMFALMLPALCLGWNAVAALLFLLLMMIQNAWRPIFFSRLDAVGDSAKGATLLSVDSQAKSLFMMVVAPLLGFGVDHIGLPAVAMAGSLGLGLILLIPRR